MSNGYWMFIFYEPLNRFTLVFGWLVKKIYQPLTYFTSVRQAARAVEPCDQMLTC